MANIHFRVAIVQQFQAALCWAACAAMVLQFKRNMSPTKNSLGLEVDDFREKWATESSLPNEASSWEDMAKRLRQNGFMVSRYPGPSEPMIYRTLAHHGPFILFHYVGSFWYGPGIPVPTKPNESHAVVVTGIDMTSHTVYFNNPWGQSDVPTTSQSVVAAIRRVTGSGYCPVAYLP